MFHRINLEGIAIEKGCGEDTQHFSSKVVQTTCSVCILIIIIIIRFLNRSSTLFDHQYHHNISFIKKLLSGPVDCHSLRLALITVPIRNTRNSSYIFIPPLLYNELLEKRASHLVIIIKSIKTKNLYFHLLLFFQLSR